VVSKFFGYHQQIENQNKNGLNNSDKIEKAKELYRRTKDTDFKFIECWNNLKIEQKWTNQSGASSFIPKNNDATNGNFSSRPAGRKASKAKDKQKNINVEKEKIEIMNKYIKSTMIHKLLKVNVTTLDRTSEEFILYANGRIRCKK
jgi:hypothetical protein